MDRHVATCMVESTNEEISDQDGGFNSDLNELRTGESQDESQPGDSANIEGYQASSLIEKSVTNSSSDSAAEQNVACAYCGVDSPECVVQCNTCHRWFCNAKQGTASSHIVHHLVLARHNSVALHARSHLGATLLECYNCGCRNVFLLGFVSAKSEAVVVLLCRMPCAQSRSPDWDTEQWLPLIDERQFLQWVVAEPSEEACLGAKLLTARQMAKLEDEWRAKKQSVGRGLTQNGEAKPGDTIDLVNSADVEASEADANLPPPLLLRYQDAYEYQRSYGPLIQLEADYDRHLKESQGLEHISVTWSLGLNNRHLASFALSTFEAHELKVAVGDEMRLWHPGTSQASAWEGHGYIIRTPNSFQDAFTLELRPSKDSPPTHTTTGFTAEFIWKGTSYDRMQAALKRFAVDNKCVSGYLYYKILGHAVVDIKFDVKMPKRLSLPNFTELNASQLHAVETALQNPLTLIQGPPGTGKTVTSATIIYHLNRIHKEKVLVCAPSNVAVDHLAAKLRDLGMKVVRLTAKSRQDVESSVSNLALHNLVAQRATGTLQTLLKLKEDVGELSLEDNQKFVSMVRQAEEKILRKADVVCCTCVGVGDKRLEGIYRTVLIDESTQATEPECLIPIVKGAKQVILVGDHQQLGPVILEKRAADAGLKQSIFERLISLGHVPIRLEVQYRMNPYLSEFPSNVFYEGSLQNGVTHEQRTITSSTFPWPIRGVPMMFWANYGKEEISANGTSYLNRIEAMNCERAITKLFKDGVKPEQIGVITPYEGQRTFILQYMQMNGFMDKDLYIDVEVASVDAFQGREKDYIILSCVRANSQQAIGFLRDPRRMNVALTRAKYGLIILGNPRSLSRNLLWSNLLLHFRERGCLVEGSLENLQLCTVQLTKPRSNKEKRYQNQPFDFNMGFDIDNLSALQDMDAQSVMSFGGPMGNNPAHDFWNMDTTSSKSKNPNTFGTKAISSNYAEKLASDDLKAQMDDLSKNLNSLAF